MVLICDPKVMNPPVRFIHGNLQCGKLHVVPNLFSSSRKCVLGIEILQERL